MAVAFDADRLALTGTPVPLLEGIMGVPPMGNAQYCFSTTGTLLYLSGGARSADEVPVWIDRSGAIDPISQLRREYFRVRLSPDGERIAAAIMDDAQYDIWILEIARDMLTRLTFDDAIDSAPVWSADGEWIYFSSKRKGGESGLFRRRADGTGEAQRLTQSELDQRSWSASPDGKWLVFEERSAERGTDIMLLSLDGEELETRAFLSRSFIDMMPAISPDGKWLTYVSDESGEFEAYVQPFPQGGPRVKVSAHASRASGSGQ